MLSAARLISESIGGVPKSKLPGKALLRSRAPEKLVRSVPCRSSNTLRPLDHGRSAIRCRVYDATNENSNACLSRSFADIKELLRRLFHCAIFAASLSAGARRTHNLGRSAAFLSRKFRHSPRRTRDCRRAFAVARLACGISAT